MRRGTPPYEGNWAPPGGYIEANESAEAAAIRETWEEVGIQLDINMLVPFAIISIESINQIYLTFLVRLDALIEPHAQAPEALEARWFPEKAFPLSDIWPPLSKVDMSVHFDRLRAGRFEFYQRTDEVVRLFSEGECFTYLRKGPGSS
jgi:8-oxo-dGTP pyrophosphatase MutT (NUDIX family)